MSPIRTDLYATQEATTCENSTQGDETGNPPEDAGQASLCKAVRSLQEACNRSTDQTPDQDRRKANRTLNNAKIQHRHAKDQHSQLPDENADEPKQSHQAA